MSSKELFTCAREGCENQYFKKTHNQKYCTDECCQLATNKRIMLDYYKDKERLAGKVRYCKICETTKLSRYNRAEICSACQTERVAAANDAVLNMLKNASLVL